MLGCWLEALLCDWKDFGWNAFGGGCCADRFSGAAWRCCENAGDALSVSAAATAAAEMFRSLHIAEVYSSQFTVHSSRQSRLL
jgi:hypothetical protein